MKIAALLTIVLAQGAPELEAVSWAGLYDDGLVERLENENRLAELCPAESRDLAACYRDAMASEAREWPVHERPEARSRRLGRVVVVSSPGRGLTVWWVPDEGSRRAFTPDIYDPDWGYGYNFHQTVLDRSGEWYLLPADPFPDAVWIRLGPTASDRVRTVAVGDIMSLDGAGWVVLEVSPDHVVMRREQEADMWCDVDPPPIRPDPGRRFTRAELVDQRGHFRLRWKYPRGC